MVARILSHNEDRQLPWHRILRSDGSVAFPKDSEHYAEQVQRLRAEGVEVATDGVDFAGDVLRGAGGGAFEDHVLYEVGEAIFFDWFVTGAGVDPGAHGDGAHVGHGLGEDEEAVGEDGAADVAGLVRRGGFLRYGHATPWTPLIVS